MARKRLYIPITRSGSSILASIFTQLIDEGRRQRRAEVNERLQRGEIGPLWAFVTIHPLITIWAVGFVLIVLNAFFFS